MKKKWTLLHFVNPDCGCSQIVVDSLMKRGADKTLSENVYVLGKNPLWLKQLSRAGYNVHSSDMNNFAEKYSIAAVPQLVIFNPERVRVYSGGYSSKKGPAASIEDQKILAGLKQKESVKELPIYGCVNGTENRNKTDILGYKYQRENYEK